MMRERENQERESARVRKRGERKREERETVRERERLQ